MHRDVAWALVFSAERFCKVGSGSCITKYINQETGNIRDQKSWSSFEFRCWASKIRNTSGFSLNIWWVVKKCPLTYSSGGKTVLKFSQRLQYVLDSASLQYTSLLAEYLFKAAGVAVKNLWRLADGHETDSVLLIGVFRANSSVAD